MKRSLCLGDDLFSGTADDDGARFAQRNAGELEEGLFADHHLFDQVAFADFDQFGVACREQWDESILEGKEGEWEGFVKSD